MNGQILSVTPTQLDREECNEAIVKCRHLNSRNRHIELDESMLQRMVYYHDGVVDVFIQPSSNKVHNIATSLRIRILGCRYHIDIFC